jgi:hypothetical protein
MRLDLALRRAAVALAASGAAACGGGGGSSPTAPGPPSAVTDLRFTITPEVGNRTAVEFAWGGGQGATSFRIEVGSTSGSSNVAVLETGSASNAYRWTPVPIGNLYARVSARNAAGSGPPSAEVLVGSVDPRDLIEALFLGSGRLAVAGNPGCFAGRMLGWRPGASLSVLVAANVSDALFVGAQQTVPQFQTGTRGHVQAATVRVSDVAPRPGVDQVAIRAASQAEVDAICRNPGVRGCAPQTFAGPYFRSVEIVYAPSAEAATVAHELGHALGLCHAIVAAGVQPPLTMGVTPDGVFSPAGRQSSLEPATLKASETVYGAGLFAGSSRTQFEAAGLVRPSAGLGLAPLAPPHSPYPVVEQDGTTVFLKPFCTAPLGRRSIEGDARVGPVGPRAP